MLKMTLIRHLTTLRCCKPWTCIYLLFMYLLIKSVNSAGTITFTAETGTDFTAKVTILGAASFNIENGWQIVLTFSDPVTDVTQVSIPGP